MTENLKRRAMKEKHARNKRNQVDPYYQEQLEEVERIKKALPNIGKEKLLLLIVYINCKKFV